jgi:nucleoside-diphosphate-sugar epimerase
VQNFIHVQDVAELEMALLSQAASSRVVNAFSDDSYGLFALAELVRARIKSRSPIEDATDTTESPKAAFMNGRAKKLHPEFRRLADHLFDTA